MPQPIYEPLRKAAIRLLTIQPGAKDNLSRAWPCAYTVESYPRYSVLDTDSASILNNQSLRIHVFGLLDIRA